MPATVPAHAQDRARFLDLPSGIGLVMGAMIGAGVFLSTGFMAQDLGPGWILLAWGTGALLAMVGARTYAEVAILIPRSGGEYRYLSELLHPALGYLAGWASLLMGFAAPTAISAYGASAFLLAACALPIDSVRPLATGLIVALTIAHAARLSFSKWTQNTLVTLNVLLLVGFVVVGFVLGRHAWPTWTAPRAASEFEALPFATSLFYVAYAFSGWNAASYAAEEFAEPRRDVPRAMLIGCGLVGVLYLLVNWVFVANLTPAQAEVVFAYEQSRVTLGHVVAEAVVGPIGSRVMSVVVALAMLSSVSVMLLVGPRVYAVMADDGFLPAALRGRPGLPPRVSVVVQGIAAVFLLHLHTVGELLTNVAGVLIFFSALVALGLLASPRRRPDLGPTRRSARVAAAGYVVFTAWMLYNAFKTKTGLLVWLLVAAVAGLVAYFWSARRQRR